jgi:hypothetical protein
LLPSGKILQKIMLKLVEKTYEYNHPIYSNILYMNDDQINDEFSSQDLSFLKISLPSSPFQFSAVQEREIRQKLKKVMKIQPQNLDEYDDPPTVTRNPPATTIITTITVIRDDGLLAEPGLEHYVEQVIAGLYVIKMFLYCI